MTEQQIHTIKPFYEGDKSMAILPSPDPFPSGQREGELPSDRFQNDRFSSLHHVCPRCNHTADDCVCHTWEDEGGAGSL
jgi:hypothetical protein